MTSHEYAKILLAMPDMPLLMRFGQHEYRTVIPVSAKPEIAYYHPPSHPANISYLCGPGDEGAVRVVLVTPADPRTEATP